MTKDKTVTMSRELAEKLEKYLGDEWDPVQCDPLDELRAILSAPVVERHEPAAWIVIDMNGDSYFAYDKQTPSDKPLYTSPPAPVAVVPDERAAFESWAQDDDRFGTSRNCSSDNYDEADTQQVWETWQARAGIDKVKELNK